MFIYVAMKCVFLRLLRGSPFGQKQVINYGLTASVFTRKCMPTITETIITKTQYFLNSHSELKARIHMGAIISYFVSWFSLCFPCARVCKPASSANEYLFFIDDPVIIAPACLYQTSSVVCSNKWILLTRIFFVGVSSLNALLKFVINQRD